MTTVRHPPGRAGRLWLRRRLATAELGGDQLSRKLRVLLREYERLREQRDQAERAWHESVALARTWQLRAGILGGQAAYTAGVPVEPVQLQVRWATVVGVTIPGSPERIGQPAPRSEVVGSSAVVAAVAAFDAALLAAAEPGGGRGGGAQYRGRDGSHSPPGPGPGTPVAPHTAHGALGRRAVPRAR